MGDRTFSEVVKEAREAGYTEPDPRDDLSGTDVARKVSPKFIWCLLCLALRCQLLEKSQKIPTSLVQSKLTWIFYSRLYKKVTVHVR